MVSFRGNSIHAPSRDPSVLPSEARVTCGAALSWRGSPERTSSLEKGFLSLPRPECFLRLSFFNALMEMKSLRMKTTDPDKGGTVVVRRRAIRAVRFDELTGTSLLSHVHVSRTYVLPETIRPSSATECVNTRGPKVWSLSLSLSVREVTRVHGGRKGGGGGSGGGDGGGDGASILRNNLEIWTISRRNNYPSPIMIRPVSLFLASPSTRIGELLSDMTRPEPDGEDQTDSRIPLRLCTSPGFPRDILRPSTRKLPSNNHEKNW
ncbi:hypothetical protein ALC56_09970 [Trachymyrmex septentrionalis]|uniref:Uncharacterized protein n=1 Tax=Trachymyrmex septentrionalis TaxID=34720 RepID=A0A151JTW2_9HYME|nr:hypothetical protein ALC56_09970 [Trachymyrmex septentrionalis]